MRPFDWQLPQRQPAEGLLVLALRIVVRLLKILWPVALAMILNSPEKEPTPGISRIEWIAMGVGAITVAGTLLQFYFFKFYLKDERLVIKKGWLKKEELTIPLESIQTVHLSQGPLHQVLGIVQLSVNTAAAQKTEVTIDALRKPMAEALRSQLLQKKPAAPPEDGSIEEPPAATPLLQLGDRDIIKLALTANHLEAFFILGFFSFGLLNDLSDAGGKTINDIGKQLPTASLFSNGFFLAGLLLVVLLFSTGRVFFRYYGFTVFPSAKGLQVNSGIMHVKERLLPAAKIQYVSWQANWMRRLFRIWMLEYHTAGDDEASERNQQQFKIPVTQQEALLPLAAQYCTPPSTQGLKPVTRHPSVVWRSFFIMGWLPAMVAGLAVWVISQQRWWWLMFWPMVTGLYAYLAQQKFRLWVTGDVAYIQSGHLGLEYTLLKWQSVQMVSVSQSLFQKRRGLATLHITTAANTISIPFIAADAAWQIANYALAKAEGWQATPPASGMYAAAL